jgi:hypothetical protein
MTVSFVSSPNNNPQRFASWTSIDDLLASNVQLQSFKSLDSQFKMASFNSRESRENLSHNDLHKD